MKKIILAAGLLSGVACMAQAQTNVTIYGVIDLGLNYTNNVGGKNDVQMESGYAQGSRLGFKGNEDLGGGLSALFQLENGFAADTGKLGQGGLMFGRQALVGLSSKTAGTVTLGRQYDSVVDFLAPMTANGNWAGYLLSHPLDNDNTDNSFRINNSLKYTSPTFAGVTFGGLYGFGETAGQTAKNRTYSLGASYANGPWAAGIAYMNLSSPGSTGAGGGAVTATDANFTGPNSKQKIFGAGVNYTIGAATLGFVYTGTNLSNPNGGNAYIASFAPMNGSTLNSLKFTNYELNFKYQFTPAFYVGAMYTYTQAKYNTSAGNSKPKWNEVGLMADYNFSKRTDVYLQGAYQKVGGDLTGSSLDQAYIPGAAGSSGNDKQAVIRAAIRHKF
ncbi:porin [Glaciimonas sp. CA11.2]|uniref:porin n=1 Tax=unclassified Glaciimonas TaxID=2644401 RepID=UPI002AB5D0B3|nr:MULTISPECIES: porin [unclassified Glaciimonas]MDY7545933.1 porin [Glaciimonas sp. CA11.2]MEB0012223.1 porin [Glaciimonas sp. Cout2]MEB0082406.1 porin [Glaciimonas sp. Gout2]MEB0161408.1 porin [Glaciimonas sp. CA11.2]